MAIQNAKIEFTPPKRADPDDIDRAFQRLSNVIATINNKLLDPDQPSIKFIGDGSATTQLSFETVVEFGASSGSVLLPLAESSAGRKSKIIYLFNTGPGTLTVFPNRFDTIDGATSITVATGTFKILRSNGVNKWFSK